MVAAALVGGLGVDISRTFLRRHIIELNRRHLQETTTAPGIPEPPPHPLSALIRPLHVYNTPPPWLLHLQLRLRLANPIRHLLYEKKGNV